MLEDKGKSILLILTFTGTLIIGTMNFLFDLKNLNWIFIILFIGIFYLILSIVSFLSVINATMFGDLDLNDSYEIKKNSNSFENTDGVDNITLEKINIKSKGDNMELGELIRFIELNQLTLLRKANDLSCGLSTLKRSFVIFFIFLLAIYINKNLLFFSNLGACIIYFFGLWCHINYWMNLFFLIF